MGFVKPVCFPILFFEGRQCHPDLTELSAGCTRWLPRSVPAEPNVFVCIQPPLMVMRACDASSPCASQMCSLRGVLSWLYPTRAQTPEVGGMFFTDLCAGAGLCFLSGSMELLAIALQGGLCCEVLSLKNISAFGCVPRRSAKRVTLGSGFWGGSCCMVVVLLWALWGTDRMEQSWLHPWQLCSNHKLHFSACCLHCS